MRRLFILLIAILLPVQFAWSAAADYCSHESGAMSKHFGHHEHQHAADGQVERGESPLAGFDADCYGCHAVNPLAIGRLAAIDAHAAAFFLIPWRAPAPAVPPSARPERPNWMSAV